MEAYEIIELIRTAEKKTPVRVDLQEKAPCEFTDAEVFCGGSAVYAVFLDLSFSFAACISALVCTIISASRASQSSLVLA